MSLFFFDFVSPPFPPFLFQSFYNVCVLFLSQDTFSLSTCFLRTLNFNITDFIHLVFLFFILFFMCFILFFSTFYLFILRISRLSFLDDRFSIRSVSLTVSTPLIVIYDNLERVEYSNVSNVPVTLFLLFFFCSFWLHVVTL